MKSFTSAKHAGASTACDPECVLLFWLLFVPAALMHSDGMGSQAEMNSSRWQIELLFHSSLSSGDEGGLLSHSCRLCHEGPVMGISTSSQ